MPIIRILGRMNARIPTNLVGHVTTLESEMDIVRQFALVSSAGGRDFEIRYSGTILEEHGLIVDHENPSLVVARAVDTREEVVLFDAARHGYDAMFVEEYDAEELAERTAGTLLERDGNTVFAVEIGVVDNIDWDDEEDDFRDEEGVLRLITGEEISSERLRADGYDALNVVATAADGTEYEVVQEELA